MTYRVLTGRSDTARSEPLGMVLSSTTCSEPLVVLSFVPRAVRGNMRQGHRPRDLLTYFRPRVDSIGSMEVGLRHEGVERHYRLHSFVAWLF